MPKISVVMPVYNGEKYLSEAIDSILNQTFTDFEFIIINDCSTDGTEGIIKSYNDSRIVYIKNGKNMGVANSLNKGLDMATGEYIARMDADDISMPQRFEKQVKFKDKHLNIAVCGCRVEMFGALSNKNVCTIVGSENMKVNMLFASCLAHPTVIMKRSIFECEHFRYDVNYEGAEDYELWTRVIFKYDMDNIDEMLLKYRIHSNQVTQRYTAKDKQTYANILKAVLDKLCITKPYADETNAYISFAMGSFDADKQFFSLVTIFNKMVDGNKQIKFCNDIELKTYLSAILISLFDKQNVVSIRELAENSKIVSKTDICINKSKKILMRLLRRDK